MTQTSKIISWPVNQWAVSPDQCIDLSVELTSLVILEMREADRSVLGHFWLHFAHITSSYYPLPWLPYHQMHFSAPFQLGQFLAAYRFVRQKLGQIQIVILRSIRRPWPFLSFSLHPGRQP